MHSFRSPLRQINIALFSLLILVCITAAPDRQWAKATAAQCQPITIIPPNLPDGAVGAAYSQNLSTIGGNRPYTFSLLSGALPTGLSLAPGGAISGTPTTMGSYSFTVRVRDSNFCIGLHPYTIDVGCPTITFVPPGILTGRIGLAYSWDFHATGGQAPYTYSISSGSLPPGLTLSPGTISGTPTTAGSYPITIRATDANGCTGEAQYTLVVACPVITVNPASLPAGATGTAYNQTFTATGGVAPYSFTISGGAFPAGLSLASNGNLTGAPTSPGNYNFNVRATDANGCFSQRAYTLAITGCGIITVNPATLPVAQVGVPYSRTFSATGGTAPYSFGTNISALPPGLSFNTNGSLTGTPTTAGSYSFIVRGNDANGCFGERSYTLVVNPACPSITVNPTSPLPSGRIATPYSQTITATGGVAPHTFSLATGSFLPAGLTLSSTGLLSGTPTVGGNFSFTIVATDAGGCIGFRLYHLFIDPCPLITVNPTSPNLPPANISSPYSQTFSATGGVAPYTFATTGNPPPLGLTFNAATGVLSGSPTQSGTFNFNVSATDANGCIGVRAYTLLVNSTCPTITVNPTNPTLPPATVGTPYNQTFSATGGVAPYLADMFSGNLPTGVSFNLSTGVLSGTPTTPGTFTFTVRFRDAGQCPGQRAYTLVVNSAPCPSISINPVNSPLPAGRVGTLYSLTFTGAGGAAPYMFRITGGALPGGLTFSSGGNLTGTPTTAGNYNFTVRMIDANGCMDEANYDLVINNATCLGITVNPVNPVLPSGVTGMAYSQRFSATSGTAPYSFAISAGALPPGSSLSSDGALTNTSFTAAGNYSFTVRASDANGCSGERQYSLVINNPACPAITVNPAALSSGVIGAAYNQTISATGGASPYSFSVSAGALPAGLALNATTGAITGSPASAGPASFTIRATDANGCSGGRAFNIIIATNLITSVSAASFAGNTPLALESIVAGFGANMTAGTALPSTPTLPTELAGASLKVRDAAGAERLAPLFYISPGQLNYQMPPNTALGPAHVSVLNNGVVTAEGAAEIATVSPGMFTADGSGQGVAAAYVLRITASGAQSNEPVAQFDAAQNRMVATPIDLGPATDQVYLILFGTGFKFRSDLSAVSVTIGGETVEALYAGEAPGFVGLDQLNTRLSRTLAGRGEVDVTISVDGKTANTVRVAIR